MSPSVSQPREVGDESWLPQGRTIAGASSGEQLLVDLRNRNAGANSCWWTCHLLEVGSGKMLGRVPGREWGWWCCMVWGDASCRSRGVNIYLVIVTQGRTVVGGSVIC